MIYLRARYYDSEECRFLSEDPHWNVDNMIYGDEPREQNNILNNDNKVYYPNIADIMQSSNLYGYCLNNPNKYKDPSGKIAIADDAVIVVYIAGAIVITTYAWLNTPMGQQALLDGATAIYDGYVIAGKAISSAAMSAANAAVQAASWVGDNVKKGWNTVFAKKSKSSNKERATDVPSWVKGQKPKSGESGKDFAKRLCDERYGKGNY